MGQWDFKYSGYNNAYYCPKCNRIHKRRFEVQLQIIISTQLMRNSVVGQEQVLTADHFHTISFDDGYKI